MVTVDPPSRPVEFTPSKTPYDPRHMLAGMTRLVGWQIDRQIPPHFSHTLFAGRYLTSNTLYSQADTSLLTHSIRRQIPHFSHTLFAGRYLTSNANPTLLTHTYSSYHVVFTTLYNTHTLSPLLTHFSYSRLTSFDFVVFRLSVPTVPTCRASSTKAPSRSTSEGGASRWSPAAAVWAASTWG